uniref:NRDE family protein n=1 Tax=Caenorhabditis tropicalis TaxID=1561998 RepID=A0A1I7TQM4_9PELO
MCITFIKTAKSSLDKYKLILLNNRDEQLLRPTKEMHWHDGILSGVDEQDEARGTWTGLNENGSIGMMLSITQTQESKNLNAPSRGGIVNSFLKASNTTVMMESLLKEAHKYNGFQLVALEQNSSGLYNVRTLTNQQVAVTEICQWDDEYQVISNSPPSKPFKKTVYGKNLFRNKLHNSNDMTVEQIFNELLQIATDETSCYPDEQLKFQTQNTDEYNRPLSAIFIKYPEEIRQLVEDVFIKNRFFYSDMALDVTLF